MAYRQKKKRYVEAWNCFFNETEGDIFLFQEGKPPEAMKNQKNILFGMRSVGNEIEVMVFKITNMS